MRKIRNAAVVGLATFSLIAGTVSPAFAADENAPKKDEKSNSSSSFGSSDKDKKKAESQEGENAETPQDKAPGWNTPAGERPKPVENHTKCGQDMTDLAETPLGDRDCETKDLSSDLKNENNSSNSSVWGNRYNSNQNVTGRNLLGLEKNFSEQPVWAQIWYIVTVLGVVGSVVGLVALPVLNQAKAQGFII